VFSRFFIDRPIFAAVLSIVIFLGGVVAYIALPVTQYPEITPPTVEVSAVYPGANSRTVADTVAAPIEQQVNGVESMLYMSSQCSNDGLYVLTVTFKLGTNLDMAQVLVQNRVNLAQPILPDVVKRRGVTVKKKSASQLMIVNLSSPDGSRDSLYLSNYATIQVRDELARLAGIGDITYMGQRDYSMRLWLDPDKMAVRGLTAASITQAVEQQNVQVAAGQIGQPPVPPGQEFQYTLTTLGRLVDAEQFADMILKTEADGRVVRMRDVARIELGAQSYEQSCTLDGRPSVALSVYQLPGSNALQTADRVREKMEELRRGKNWPPGVEFDIVYDTTPFIRESIYEVYRTLILAVILVAVVVLVFLQNWRSAIIPLAAVPVAIIGTFAAMWVAGFSLNNLTLFGLVLAIGIVVDDAIVVVEAVEYQIEHGLGPRDAAIRAMELVSGPVIAIGLVLTAVFVPCAFIGGITGQFFRQFAVTIAVSTIISAFNSVTLSPALAALLLRPRDAHVRARVLPWPAYVLIGGVVGWLYLTPALGRLVGLLSQPLATRLMADPWALSLAAAGLGGLAGWAVSLPLDWLLAHLFGAFNAGFNFTTKVYTGVVARLLRVSALVLLVYAGLLALTYWAFTHTPTGFIPAQDKGYLLVNVQLPDAAAAERTRDVMEQIEQVALHSPGVKHTVAVSGQSILLNTNAPNFGAMYVMLTDFHERTDPELSADAIAERLQAALADKIPDGLVNLFGAPPVEGLGTAGGFKIVIEDRGDTDPAGLQRVADRVVDEGNRSPDLRGVFTAYRANTPWLYLDIDRTQVMKLGVLLGDVFDALQVFLGSYYINDFNRFGRTWEVNVQADASFRDQIEDIKQLKVRSSKGGMVPLGSMAQVRDTSGPATVVRFNLYTAAMVNGNQGPGVSSGEAIARLEALARESLGPSMRTEWTELALLQLQTGYTALLVFVLAVVLVFLVLAAQYESWSLPLAVILVVPMCLLCSIAGVQIARQDVNIFTQVGFVVLVGLACKNAILIVEYAKAQHEAGAPRYQATLDAVRLRLRPILMTSFAFILGVVPLVVSVGAGAEMRRTLGTAVFAGMLGVTLFGIILTPVFYYVIQWFGDRRAQRLAEAAAPVPSTAITARRPQ
jgi:multidrug efflux pump